ncbi:MAG TPA: DUF2330 domain-containing protein [Frankiaceae bacterium]|nr:DUF2330 domain-containing protein [Frankiaceae bacterium]
MRRVLAVAGATVAFLVGVAGPAVACGGLIGPNGAVNLLRTTTFAGYHDGVEHYVTSFAFAGGGGAFGSLTPLPGVPTKVERGGDWTLQRLIRETTAVAESARFAAPTALASKGDAEVIMKVKVDALDITVLKGGGKAVGEWATEHGFRLPPDAPEVLDFYARRSPIFLAAAFDANEAKKRGQNIGDGTPVHITIPTANPWVPLRILALGKDARERVEADVYLLTDRRPNLLSTTRIGTNATLSIEYDDAASESLLRDLRDDKTGDWVPDSGWLTKVTVSGPAGDLTGDLAIDANGVQEPSMVAAGFNIAPGSPGFPQPYDESPAPAIAVAVMAGSLLTAAAVSSFRGRRTA